MYGFYYFELLIVIKYNINLIWIYYKMLMLLKMFIFCIINCIVEDFLFCILFFKIKNKDLNEGIYNCKLIFLDFF